MVRYTQESVDEYPALEKEVSKYGIKLKSEALLPKSLFLGEQIVVQGECGDQVFGSDVLETHVEELKDDWKNVFKWDRVFHSNFFTDIPILAS